MAGTMAGVGYRIFFVVVVACCMMWLANMAPAMVASAAHADVHALLRVLMDGLKG
jgi:hypothetical protein